MAPESPVSRIPVPWSFLQTCTFQKANRWFGGGSFGKIHRILMDGFFDMICIYYISYTNTLEDAVFCSFPTFQSGRLKAQLSTGLLLQCPAVVWVLWAIPYLQQATRPNQATLAVRPVWSCNCLSALSLMTWFLGKCAGQIVSQAFSHVSSSYLKTTNSSSSSMSSKLLLSEDPWTLDHLSNFHSGVISWTWILWNATASFFRGTQCWQAHSLWVYPQ